jgi:ribosome-associated heat shock protein Hsp15
LSEDRQRIDKWLWHARVVRTRSAAAELAASGHVRVNGQRVMVPARVVRLGDVVTVALDRTVRVLKVTGFAARRGSAPLARELYEDMSPPQIDAREAGLMSAIRPPGAGRPTKRDRRKLALLIGDQDGENGDG